MIQRPDIFTLNPYHPLAQGLVFAGLGAYAGSLRYHDSSVYGHAGTLVDMTPASDWTWADSLGRMCLDFDANNDIVQVTDAPQINPTAAITLAIWAKPTNVSANKCLFQKGYTAAASPYYQYALVHVSNGALYFQLVLEGTWRQKSTAAGVITAGSWQHFAAVYTGDTMGIYKNGVLSGTLSNYSGAISQYATTLGIGRYGSGWTTYGTFDGNLADALIYSRALSNTELQQLADPSDVMLSGLILPPARKWWPVSGGAGGATTIDCTLGTVSVAANNATVTADTDISATSGAVTIAGYNATVTINATVSCTAGAVTIAANNATVTANTDIASTVGTVTITGLDATVTAGTSIAATTGTITITALNATVTNKTQINATAGAITAAALDATVTNDTDINATTGTVAITALDATVQADTLVSATAGSIAVTGLDATVTNGVDVACAKGTITVAPLAAVVSAATKISATLGTVTLASYAATITTTTTTADGIDYATGDHRPHYGVADHRPHYRATDSRPHYTAN